MTLNESQLDELDAALAAAQSLARQNGTPAPLDLPGGWSIVDTPAACEALASAIERRADVVGITVARCGTAGTHPSGAYSPLFYTHAS